MGDWFIPIVAAVFLAASVGFFYMLWFSGETVGSITCYTSTQFFSDRTVNLVVKRDAPKGKRTQPIVMLQARRFMGATIERLSAAEAKRMADAIEDMVNRKIPPRANRFRGYQLEQLPGEVGLHLDMSADVDVVAHLEYPDAHELARMLRTAAA